MHIQAHRIVTENKAKLEVLQEKVANKASLEELLATIESA